jgi:hypothetical protein
MVALTQLLYEQTEAELSLVVAVVKSGTVQEALFWAGELHGSGLHDRVWEVIWYIYYDFFAIHHPLLGQHLQMFHEEYREGPALTPLAHAVYNLAIRTPRTEIFEARIHSQQHCPIPCRTFKDLADLWTHGSLLEIGAFLSSTDLSTDTLTDSVKFAFPAQLAQQSGWDALTYPATTFGSLSLSIYGSTGDTTHARPLCGGTALLGTRGFPITKPTRSTFQTRIPKRSSSRPGTCSQMSSPRVSRSWRVAKL